MHAMTCKIKNNYNTLNENENNSNKTTTCQLTTTIPYKLNC